MRTGDLVNLTKRSPLYESPLYDGIKDDLMIVAEDEDASGELFYVLHPQSASLIAVRPREVVVVSRREDRHHSFSTPTKQ